MTVQDWVCLTTSCYCSKIGKLTYADLVVNPVIEINEQLDRLLVYEVEVIGRLPNCDEFPGKIMKIVKKETSIAAMSRDYHEKANPYHRKEYSICEFGNLLEECFEMLPFQYDGNHFHAQIKKNECNKYDRRCA